MAEGKAITSGGLAKVLRRSLGAAGLLTYPSLL